MKDGNFLKRTIILYPYLQREPKKQKTLRQKIASKYFLAIKVRLQVMLYDFREHKLFLHEHTHLWGW